MSKQLRLGLFVSTTQNYYENALYNGVVDAACAVDAHLICITSGALRAYRGFEFQRNVLFDLVNEHNVDGLIISGTLAHPITLEETQEFFRRFDHIPKVSVALSIPGTPSVMVDSQYGIRSVVDHLIKVHGYQRFAFIRGPLEQQEADERYHAYCESLEKHGLVLDPDLIVSGDYSVDSGAAAMRALLHRSEVRFQAVVSSNDSMALGAISVLKENGFRVPEQVAITGFDDDNPARFGRVPLTTVRQNIYDQGRLAIQLLLDQVAGRKVALQNVSTPHLVVRRSCGCTGDSPVSPLPVPRVSQDWSEMLRTCKPGIVEAVCSSMAHIPSTYVAGWVESWLDAVYTDLSSSTRSKPDQGQAFLAVLEEAQRAGAGLGIELAVWQRALLTFFTQVKLCFSDPAFLQVVEKLTEDAQNSLGAVMERLENERRFEIENRELTLREISESLTTTFEMGDILDVLTFELPRLYVQACYISLFEDPQNPAGLARLIFAWQDNQRIELAPGGLVFPSTDWMPREFQPALASSGLVVEALYSKEDRLGFMLLDLSPPHITVSNALRPLISGALQGVLLLEQRRRAEEKLLQSQDQMEALIARLEYANSELESFVYSVSHDLRSPLRAIAGFSSILNRDYRSTLSDDASELLDKVVQNTSRMGHLIDDLLAFSRVGRHELRMTMVDMVRMVQETIDELSQEVGERQVDWSVGDLPTASADPALIRQVWINLLNNAVKYTSHTSRTQITLGYEESFVEIVYFVQDNGIGFDMRYSEKIFGVFQRLHHETDFPGTGIGLAIVQRIIQRHGGRVWAESEVGRGSIFYFSLPK